MAVVVAAIVVATLYIARDVLIPITLAVMLSFVLSPLVDFLRRIGLWPAPAVGLSVLVALGAIGLIGTLLGNQAAALSADVPRYVEAIEGKVARIQVFAITRVASLTHLVSGGAPAAAPVPPPVVPPRSGRTDPAAPLAGTHQQPVVVELATPKSSALAVARALIEPVLGPLETTVIVLIVAIFILMQRQDLRDRFIRLFGATDLHRTTMAIDDAGQRLSRYFVSQLGGECLLRSRDRSGALADRYTVSSTLGGAGRSASVRPLRRAAAGGGCAADTCGGRRSRLVDDNLCGAAVRDHRTTDGICGRTASLRPLHRTVSGICHRRGRFLDMDLGAGRSDPLHAIDALSRRDGTARQSRSSSLTSCWATGLLCRKSTASTSACSPTTRTRLSTRRRSCSRTGRSSTITTVLCCRR